MRLTIDLKVYNYELFDAFVQSVIADVKASEKRTVKSKDLKEGFTYKRTANNGQEVRVTITKFIKNTVYESEILMNSGVEVMSYEIKPLNERNCQVVFTQTSVPKSSSGRLIRSLKNAFFSYSSKKTMKKRFLGMEKYILENKSNFNNIED